MSLLALALAFSAFAALSLGMEKHRPVLAGAAPASARRLRAWRVLGWLLLTGAFALCVGDQGWALGPVVWLGALTVAGLLLAYGLHPYRPRWIVPLAWALPAVALGVAWLPV
ncbi:DUF3325 domain-containing protein [Stenotrophomonas mori]|uniref:DUF3325 domain-containing protein n=1 Tax=Stenotrophomonas mori TaxID=2871096 RepID=A0ABT0SG03_9GAMM|nr:DUF3325 domain-containing protein [Stenotrophomonas mori]MCL7714251.1 DUF3325 domain-containing protein [Stenotrophomonas mori]